jgi:long-chain acyl-CoA synthetase
VLKSGGIVVPIDKELKSAELRHVLVDSSPRVLFIDRAYLNTLLDFIDDLPWLERIVMLYPSGERRETDLRTAKAIKELLDEWRQVVDTTALPPERVNRLEEMALSLFRMLGAPSSREKGEAADPLVPRRSLRRSLMRKGRLVTFDALLQDAPPTRHIIKPTDTALILYTSGTTGRSKGAMLSHGNVVSNIRGATSEFELDERMSTLSFLPINHVFEQVVGILLPLSLGGSVSFAESLKKLGENLVEVKPSFFLGVPAVYRMFLDRIRKNVGAGTITNLLYTLPLTRPLVATGIRRTFGENTIFVSGGAPLDPEVAKGLRDLGLTIIQGYGITETSPIISAERRDRMRIGTVGLLFPGVEVRIDTPNDEGVGEIVVRGPNIMQGYYNNPRATADVLQNGWYRTGDLGRIEADGFLSICGRVKNLIVTPNGKNVYPEEVETELLKSPFIAEVMVYGHKVSSTAEEVHALIYPNQEAIDDFARSQQLAEMSERDVEALIRREVQKACDGLAEYKRVRRFTLRDDEFPKTTTRKIKRFVVEASIALGDG